MLLTNGHRLPVKRCTMNFKRKGMLFSFDSVTYLLVVVLLVGMGTYGFRAWADSSRRNTAGNDIATIASAVSQYHYDLDSYPAELADLTKAKNGFGPWLTEVKKDPWGKDYHITANKQRFIVYSYANDSGEGTAPDINKPPTAGSTSLVLFTGQ